MILSSYIPTVVALSSSLDERTTQSLHDTTTTSSPSSIPSSTSSSWNKHADTIIIASVAGTFGLILIICIILCLFQNKRHKRKQQLDAQRDLEKSNIQTIRDKTEEVSSSSSAGSRTPLQQPAPFVEPVSVFESDDEGANVMKRAKTALRKSMKGKPREKRLKIEEFDRRVVIEGGMVSPRVSRNVFEDMARGHDHRVVYEVRAALGETSRGAEQV